MSYDEDRRMMQEWFKGLQRINAQIDKDALEASFREFLEKTREHEAGEFHVPCDN